MATMEVTPSMMKSIAGEVKTQIEQYQSAVDTIYQYQAELNSMWEGEASEAFNATFLEDRPKFNNLITLMGDYQNAIIQIADNYAAGDSEVKSIVTRR